jgi:hypothetical protein
MKLEHLRHKSSVIVAFALVKSTLHAKRQREKRVRVLNNEGSRQGGLAVANAESSANCTTARASMSR